jgi:hypothetical protein
MYQTLQSCTFQLKEAETMCRDLLGSLAVTTNLEYTSECHTPSVYDPIFQRVVIQGIIAKKDCSLTDSIFTECKNLALVETNA